MFKDQWANKAKETTHKKTQLSYSNIPDKTFASIQKQPGCKKGLVGIGYTCAGM